MKTWINGEIVDLSADEIAKIEAERKKTEQQTKFATRKKLTSILEENLENLKGAQETAFGFAGD